MVPTPCTCAFRLFHFNAAMSKGGASASCTGVPLGKAKRVANDQPDTVAAYLGSSTNRAALPSELQNDEELGFSEDVDLQVRMPSQPAAHVSRMPHALPA